MGDGAAAVGAAGGHAGAADGVAGDGEGYGGVVLGDRWPWARAKIGLVDFASGEHLAQLAVGHVIFRYDDGTGGLLIEAVDDAGAEAAGDVGEGGSGHVEEERVDEGSRVSIVVRRASTGVNHHAGVLVDYGEVLVFEEDAERDVLGSSVERLRLGLALDLDAFSSFELVLCFRDCGVDTYLASVDEHLHAGAGDVRQSLREIGVDSESGGRGVGCETAHRIGVFVVFEIQDGHDCGHLRLHAAGGDVLGTHGTVAMSLRQHVLRRHDVLRSSMTVWAEFDLLAGASGV